MPRRPSARPAKLRGPGPSKARGAPRPTVQRFELWLSSDAFWRYLFETADVMSEGAVRQAPAGATYYGTTSVLLRTTDAGGRLEPDDLALYRSVAAGDPHARLRALRIAHHEARVRADLPLACMRMDLRATFDPAGLRFDVDVEAVVRGQPSARSPEAAQAAPSRPAKCDARAAQAARKTRKRSPAG